MLLLGLEIDEYPHVTSVIVHPSTVRLHGQHRTGSNVYSSATQTLAGQAQYRGPVVLSWSAARRGAARPDAGSNVVYHEFAHQLDMRDGIIDGTPPLPDDDAIQRWIEVCTPRYEAVLEGTDDGLLDEYAGEDAAEFFAVATETFFSRPKAMRQQDPELYDVLDGYYRQDPASREDRVVKDR
jgi:Mlc titration factor MtfA (ptsG expression regulator)